MTDPRDAVLFSHTPVIPVPRYSTLAPLTKAGHRYLAADDGLWLEVRRAWLHAILPLAPVWGGGASWDHSLPFGRVEKRVAYTITDDQITSLQGQFLRDARAALPNEFAAWGVYDSLTGQLGYQPLMAIEAGPGGIEFHRPTLGLNEHLAVDLHSHGTMDAFFSSTDDEDDRGEVKLSVVVGRLDREPMWATRLCLLGICVGPDDPTEEHTRKCRECGCTDERACPGGCDWVAEDLCSTCGTPA